MNILSPLPGVTFYLKNKPWGFFAHLHQEIVLNNASICSQWFADDDLKECINLTEKTSNLQINKDSPCELICFTFSIKNPNEE